MRWVSLLSGVIKCLFSSKTDIIAENIALRQKLSVYKIKNKCLKLNQFDHIF